MAKDIKDNVFVLNIYASFNNTVVSLNDLAGNTIGKVTGGLVTKHNRMKANPTIAMFIAKRIQEMCRDYKVTNLEVRMRGQTGATGIGPGANAIIKTLTKEGIRIRSISDVTKIPRGGPKKKGGRRGRRV
ncbi:30S ribosomal protein S11 [Candidatus Pacearchaeota archaeon]|jgi:ribosomal protein S11|nr:30S ribosomal protein S11 [Candidatus Pacearchaeota archaeon]|tara:strand:- start:13914 stop:14303 length:390 start_codon:yes stop_codon:yes gene_type:complete